MPGIMAKPAMPVRVSLALDADLNERLLEAARRYGERPTDLIRRAVTQLLDYLAATEAHLARLTPRDEGDRQ